MMQLCRDQARTPTSGQTPEKKGIGPYIFKHNLGLGATGTNLYQHLIDLKSTKLLTFLFRNSEIGLQR
jgi:hypothetical protein